MLRVASELRPHWIIGENVENAVRLVLDDILDSLEGIGYTAQAFVVSAYCAGSWFDGKRTFVVASSNDRGSALWRDAQLQADASLSGCRGDLRGRAEIFDTGKWWALESRPYGVVDGVPSRMDRLKCLGNAVVPAQAYPFFKAIADMERN